MASNNIDLENTYYFNWLNPILESLRTLGGTGTFSDVCDTIAKKEGLTEEFIARKNKGGSNKFKTQVSWANYYLKQAGYTASPKRGIWELTERGKDIILSAEEIARILSEVNPHSMEDDSTEVRYWVYTPGVGGSKWNEFQKNGIMAMELGEIGDLREYPDRDSIQETMVKVYDGKPHTNASLMAWNFCNKVKPGDVVYAKKGRHTMLGKGIVTSDYLFYPEAKKYGHVRKIDWLIDEKVEISGNFVAMMLVDVTPYTGYHKELDAYFNSETEEEFPEEHLREYPPYDRKDFLNDVFIDSGRYDVLIGLLKNKKNIILQGAPGTGKTYAAKRLAYSIIGTMDASRVTTIQFHQSYSYEDFIMGFRPSKERFSLAYGPFYEFCKKAENNEGEDYFFIIDEINRGNLSKIFGELMMLIESDKRGERIRLLYSDEQFSVPRNVHIIGTMNTADRSLALIDYALRRRFAFFEMEPAFDSNGFIQMVEERNDEKFRKLIGVVRDMNTHISNDDSLGKGFRVGHSYFCSPDEEENWLRHVVEYELIPLIKEYWFDNDEEVKHWSEKLMRCIE